KLGAMALHRAFGLGARQAPGAPVAAAATPARQELLRHHAASCRIQAVEVDAGDEGVRVGDVSATTVASAVTTAPMAKPLRRPRRTVTRNQQQTAASQSMNAVE